MYRVRIFHTPVSGKGPQLRAALEEHSKASNTEGGMYSVSQQLYAPENVFINQATYENLAALDAYNAKPMDEARGGRIAKIGEFSERRWATLTEILVGSPPNADFNYVLRVIYSPLVGKGGELRKNLEERVRTRYPFSGNLGAGMDLSVVGDSPTIAVNVFFPNLAGLEEFRITNQSDSAFQASQAKIINLTASPPRMELIHVLLRAS